MTLPACDRCGVTVRPRATASVMHSRAMAVRVRLEAPASRRNSASVSSVMVVEIRVRPLPAVVSDLRRRVRFMR